jgi:hypothetical protein
MSLPVVELVEINRDGDVAVTIGHGPAERTTVLVTDAHFADHGVAQLLPVIHEHYRLVKGRGREPQIR